MNESTPLIIAKASSEIIRLFYRDYEPGVDAKQREIEAVIARALGASSGLFVQLQRERHSLRKELEATKTLAAGLQAELDEVRAEIQRASLIIRELIQSQFHFDYCRAEYSADHNPGLADLVSEASCRRSDASEAGETFLKQHPIKKTNQ